MKALCLFAIVGLATTSAADAQDTSRQPIDPVVANALRETVSVKPSTKCRSDDRAAVIVCG